MIILGLVVGPAIGLLAGDFFARYRGSRWQAISAIALFFVFLIFAPFFTLELKIGLGAGTLLGLLVFFSPVELSAPLGASDRE
ncbi:MAG: hypothetical protein NVS1B6_19160 [Steroidobacteraceae bacterium]